MTGGLRQGMIGKGQIDGYLPEASKLKSSESLVTRGSNYPMFADRLASVWRNLLK